MLCASNSIGKFITGPLVIEVPRLTWGFFSNRLIDPFTLLELVKQHVILQPSHRYIMPKAEFAVNYSFTITSHLLPTSFLPSSLCFQNFALALSHSWPITFPHNLDIPISRNKVTSHGTYFSPRHLAWSWYSFREVEFLYQAFSPYLARMQFLSRKDKTSAWRWLHLPYDLREESLILKS